MAKTKEKPKSRASKPKTAKSKAKTAVKAAKAKPKKPEIPLTKVRYCSFCGHGSDERNATIAGPNNIFICCECVDMANAIMLEVDKDNKSQYWRKRMTDRLNNKNKPKFEIIKKRTTK